MLALITVAAVVPAFYGCKPKEQLDRHFRPREGETTFKDMRGDPLEDILTAYEKLGVFDIPGGGWFQPNEQVERGTFLTWLIRGWNIYYRDQPKVWIRLAPVTRNATWTFGDAMPHTPLYPYLEGMIQAGRLVGFRKDEWEYSRRITREELILLRNSVVMCSKGKNSAVFAREEDRDEYRVRLRSLLSDADDVTEEYLPAVVNDITHGESIKLAFSDLNLADRKSKPALQPSRLVTRREAVLALSKLGKRNYRNAAVAALGEWKPLTKAEWVALDKQDEATRKAASAGGHEH
jgi:hypothetical protein